MRPSSNFFSALVRLTDSGVSSRGRVSKAVAYQARPGHNRVHPGSCSPGGEAAMGLRWPAPAVGGGHSHQAPSC